MSARAGEAVPGRRKDKRMPYPRGLLMAVCALLLTGCATVVHKSQKMAGYEGRIDKLAIVYVAGGHFQAPAQKDNLGGRYYASGPRVEAHRAKMRHNLDLLARYMDEQLPGLAKASGMDAVYAGLNAEANPAALTDGRYGERAVLLIVPYQANMACRTGCQLVVRVRAELFDRRLNRTVWKVNSDILGGPFSADLTRDNVRDYWGVLVERMKADGLLAK